MYSSARLAITPGEPAGIGPDLILRLAQDTLDADIRVIADPDMLYQRAQQLSLPIKLDVAEEHESSPHQRGTLKVVPVYLATPARPGRLNKDNAPYVLKCLQTAAEGCMSGRFDAQVTGPVHKGVINEAGITFSGHTEFLAEHTNTKKVVMMLATPKLRVALVTTHLPLSAVPAAINQQEVEEVIRILHHDLQVKFHIHAPNIVVCGLNPHAGEDGHMGREEIDIIDPVVERLVAEGMKLTGSVPADSAFTPQALKGVDAVLTMYHDQGLPVLKHQGFGAAVNITLGLPIIRTSVDHGTALTLAGTGQAQTSSMHQAIKVAAQMATQIDMP